MKYLKIFENFDESHMIKWPEAIYWIHKLYPEEICYLAMYSDALKNYNERDFRFRYSNDNPVYPIPVDGTREKRSVDPDEDGDVDFGMYYIIPSEKGDISFSYEAKGGVEYSKYYPGTYFDPPEGGESTLEELEIIDIYYLYEAKDENEADVEINFSNYQFKSDIITKSDFFGMMEAIAGDKVNCNDLDIDDSYLSKFLWEKPDSSIHKLYKKCEDVMKTIPNLDILKRGNAILRRFQ